MCSNVGYLNAFRYMCEEMMTGREKIEAAFSTEGSEETGALICYEGIFVRDHWRQLSDAPWWHRESPDLETQLEWRREVVAKTGQDWFNLPLFYARSEREHLAIEEREDGVYWIDRLAGGEAELMREPQVGGWSAGGGLHSVKPGRLAETEEEVDARIGTPPEEDPEVLKENGRGDLAAALLAEFGDTLYPMVHITSPLWYSYQIWGFEGMMEMVALRPELVERACERALVRELYGVRRAAALGARGIWIEECLTDMIGPEAFARLNAPYVRRLVEEIRACGMHSIYYYCGDPQGKWDQLLDVGADALSLEESKKGFRIEIDEVVERADGRCAVLGNLDAVGMLQDGSEEALRAEIARQIAAGRRNGSRFAMSLGSPVTPGTPVERVRLYCDLVRELGGR